jgi:hypothetical protein
MAAAPAPASATAAPLRNGSDSNGGASGSNGTINGASGGSNANNVPTPARAVPTHAMSGHIVLCGCQDSFAAFAAQLHASCPRGAAPPLVVLHPDLKAGVMTQLRLMGPTRFVRGLPSEAAALYEAGAQRAR